jgi:hypothetical protein
MGPGSRRRCPPSSPGANGTKGGLLRRLFYVGPSAVAALVAPIGLAPGLAPLPLRTVYDSPGWPFPLARCGANRVGSHEVPVWTMLLSNVSSLRMQAVIATLNALPRCKSLSL